MNTQSKKSHRLLLHTILLSANLASFSAVNAYAIDTQDSIVQSPTTREFRQLDRNNDNKLSSTEVKADSDFAHGFSKADTNHDGTLSLDEYGTYKSAMQKARMESFLDDSSITARVKAEILKDNGIKGISISVETYHGRVILSGFVDNQQQVQRAVQVASGVRGVSAVKNSLIVKN